MMPDIAALGIEIETSQAASATQILNQFANAAVKAEQAQMKLARAAVTRATAELRALQASGSATAAQLKAATTAQTQARAELASAAALASTAAANRAATVAIQARATAEASAAAAAARSTAASAGEAAALHDVASAATTAESNVRRFNRAANDNIKTARSFQTANIGAQFHDVAVTAAMGMNPLQIALQQGTQLAQVIDQMDRPLAGLAHAFTRLLSPVMILTIAFVAAAAALLQTVNFADLAGSAVSALADAIIPIAPYAVTAAAAMALLYAPAIFAGLTALSQMILGLTAQLVGLAIGFALANPGVAFIAGVAVVVAALNIFREDLQKIFGVDVIGIVKSAVNYIIGSFFAAYHDIQFLWKNFPDLIMVAVTGAVNFVIRGVNNMVDKVKAGINTIIPYLNKIPGVDISPIGENTARLSEMDDGGAADRLAKANKEQKDKVKHDLSRDYLGEFGQGIAEGAEFATGKLKDLAKWLETVGDKTKKNKGAHEKKDPYESIVARAQGRIAAAQAEQAALGLTALEAEKLKNETDLLNQARQRGIVLTPQQTAELKSYADQLAEVTIATNDAKAAMDFARDLGKGFIDDIRTGLMDGKSWWEAFGNAAINVINKIVDKIETDLVDALVNAASAGFKSGASGGGGMWGALLGGVGSLLGFGGGGGGGGDPWAGMRTVASARGNVFEHSLGGIVNRLAYFPMANGGVGSVAERNRPEAVLPLRRSSSGQLGVQVAGGGGGGTSLSFKIDVDARGSQQGVGQEIAAALEQFSRVVLPQRLKDIKIDPRKRG